MTDKKITFGSNLMIWFVIIIILMIVMLYETIEDEEITVDDMNMDNTILHLQVHCINDINTLRNNIIFCGEFMNQSKILSLYNWGN